VLVYHGAANSLNRGVVHSFKGHYHSDFAAFLIKGLLKIVT